MDSPRWSVYIHTVPNGKVYVGTTSKKPYKRWNYGHGYKQNTSFYADIQRYGWINITHEIVKDGLSEDDAYALEKELIEKFKANDPKYGYNKAGGGFGTTGFYPSEKSRAKMSASQKGKRNHCVQVCQLSDNGECVAEFASIKEASSLTGINYKSIVNCCSGVTKQAGGYFWRHKNKKMEEI